MIMKQREFHTRFGIDPPVRCNELPLLTCPYVIGLLGRQTSPRAISFCGGTDGHRLRIGYPLPHDLQELRQEIITVATAKEEDLLEKVW
jgi:hypothetical protein